MTDERAVTQGTPRIPDHVHDAFQNTHGATYTMHTATSQMRDTSHPMHAVTSDTPRPPHNAHTNIQAMHDISHAIYPFPQNTQHSSPPVHTIFQTTPSPSHAMHSGAQSVHNINRPAGVDSLDMHPHFHSTHTFTHDAHNTSQVVQTTSQDSRPADQPTRGDEQGNTYQNSHHAYPISGDAHIDTEQAVCAARRPLTMIEEARAVEDEGTVEPYFGDAPSVYGQEGEGEQEK